MAELMTHGSVSEDRVSSRTGDISITNCHVHTFTRWHTPRFFLRFPLNYLVRGLAFLAVTRWVLVAVTRRLDPGRGSPFTRYVEIVSVSYEGGQSEIFDTVKGFYPDGTRFVVLPMDMTFMGTGAVKEGIGEQHDQLANLRNRPGYHDLVLPFAAVDPRHDNIFRDTKRLIARRGFCGIKLYPPMGYHPADTRLNDLYAFANTYRIPVLTHCSRPADPNKYRGPVTEEMRKNSPGCANFDRGCLELLMTFTDPDAYKSLLKRRSDPNFDDATNLQLCLAHFGGQGDWSRYLNRPGRGETARLPLALWRRPLVWLGVLPEPPRLDESWLMKILTMLRDYENLWTDISYTLFADDEFVYLLKVLLQEDKIRSRVLFGSDFYVVLNARLEERRRSVRIRAILGEDVYREIAEVNPRKFLNLNRSQLEEDLKTGRLKVE